jgi:hypothetical protein
MPLFPDGVAAWVDRTRQAEELAVMADRIAELDGVAPAVPTDPDAVASRTAVLAADLVKPARATALDELDEGRQALTFATGGLRSKAQPGSAATDAERSSQAATL